MNFSLKAALRLSDEVTPAENTQLPPVHLFCLLSLKNFSVLLFQQFLLIIIPWHQSRDQGAPGVSSFHQSCPASPSVQTAVGITPITGNPETSMAL